MSTGNTVGLLEGVVLAIADELYEMSGSVMARSSAPYAPGDASISMETTLRFPDSGRLSLGGEIAFYASKTPTTFDGLTDVNGAPGVQVSLPVHSVILDITKTNTQLDGLRESFIVTLAEGKELDILARNYGLFRPRGVDDDTFRDLLRVLIFGLAQTMYLIEQVLDVLVGVGLWEAYEDLESFPHTVFVVIGLTTSTTFVGKTYFAGGEGPHVTGGGGFTVTVDHDVTVAYGAYADTDPTRQGTNYLLLPLVTSTIAAFPRELRSVGLFLASDDGKPLILDGTEIWTATYVSPNILELSRGPYADDGTTDAGSPSVFESTFRRFSPWMVGHQIRVKSGPDSGLSFTISGFVDAGSVTVTPATLQTATDVEWELLPVFGTVGGRTAEINRATVAGAVITAPAAMPASVLVDYTHDPSAQAVQDPGTSGETQYPFYLSQEGAILLAVLDLITAAGVRVVLVSE